MAGCARSAALNRQLQVPAAVDVDRLSGDVAGVVGAQEHARGGDVVRRARPPHRGAGHDGVDARQVAPRLRSLTLLDIAAANVAHLRDALAGQPNLRFVCADVCQPGLGAQLGRTFDAAYAIEVFELLPDPEQCLRNFAEVLRPGGRLLLQFPNYPPSLSPGMTHFRTKAELGRLLQRAGFAQWNVCSLRLRPHAWFLYEHLHERPIRAYRRHRSRNGHDRPLIYDESWAFQHGRRLEPFKYALHTAWAALSAAMRDDILNRNLIVLARR